MRKILTLTIAAAALSLVAGDRPARRSMRVAPPGPPLARVTFREIAHDEAPEPLYRTQAPAWGSLEHYYDRPSDTLFSVESYLYEDGSQEQYLKPHTTNFDPQDAPPRPARWNIQPRCSLAMESASNQANAATGQWTLKGKLGCLGSLGATPCNGASAVAKIYQLSAGNWTLIGQHMVSSTQINCFGEWNPGLLVSVTAPGTFYCTWVCNSGFDLYWNLRTDMKYGS